MQHKRVFSFLNQSSVFGCFNIAGMEINKHIKAKWDFLLILPFKAELNLIRMRDSPAFDASLFNHIGP